MKSSLLCLIAVTATFALQAELRAQVTTSSLSGRVTDDDKSPLGGAEVTAVHNPSGTRYSVSVNGEGFYTIHGMRPGGPYEVTISFPGYETTVFRDINIHLGETCVRDASLTAVADTLDEIVVTAPSAFDSEKTGPVTNLSTAVIMNLPNSDRSIASLTKISPYANGMSFAGSDGRSTSFTIDGSNFNNNLGYSDALPGGGNPVSIDAIEEIQMAVAPYDVRESNFIGGAIHAITKSGTNTFRGSAYAYHNNQALCGHRAGDIYLGAPKSNSTDFGFTFGGPIIRDKLFFFTNFEMKYLEEQVILYQADRAKQDVLQKIRDKLLDDYGYDPGSFTDYPGGGRNIKALARIDWNISDRHKASFRFNYTTDKLWEAPNGNSCDDNFRNRSYSRSSTVSQPFSGNLYRANQYVLSFAAELNSRVTDRFGNRLLISYTDNSNFRDSNSDRFPHIDIMSGDLSTGNFIPYTSLGYELFSYRTGGTDRTAGVSDYLTFYLGRHTLTAGLNYEFQYASNTYMRNGAGYYRFASAEDFLDGKLPLSTAFCYGYNGNENPSGAVIFHHLSGYVQDEWAIGEKLKLQYGVRTDMMFYDGSTLVTNNAILALDYNGRHIDTGEWPAAQVQFSPRLGFNWKVLEDKKLTIRGGTGLFQGRLPLVFLTNMPISSGMLQNMVSRGDYSAAITGGEVRYSDAQKKNLMILNGNRESGGHLITDVNAMVDALGLRKTISPEEGYVSPSSSVIGVDRNFKMPQSWKSSLAVDCSFPTPFPLDMTVEGIFDKVIYGVNLSNWNINRDAAATKRFRGQDDRYDYRDVPFKYCSNDAYVLCNSRDGWSYTANITVNASPVKNLNLTAAYTHTQSKEISGIPGFNASSAYTALPSVNGPEFQTIQSSIYVVPDKIMLDASYFIPWEIFDGRGLHLNLLYTAYQGSNNSFVFSNDMNGDGIAYDLIYIPSTRDELKFKTEQDRDAFWTFINNDDYLRQHKGSYAEAYAAHSPFVHRLDLRVAEDFAFRIGDTRHNFQLSISVDNLLNLFNPSLGVTRLSCYQSDLSTGTIAPLKYEYTDAGSEPVYSMNKVNGEYPVQNYTGYYGNPSETWKILFGIKYIFN